MNVVKLPRRCLVKIHKQCRVFFIGKRREMYLAECLTIRQPNFVIRNLQNVTQIDETLTERSAIHDQHAVIRREAIHESGFHRSSSRRRQIDGTRRVCCLHELLEQTVCVEHHLGKLRRTEIWYLPAPTKLLCDFAEHLYRANRK